MATPGTQRADHGCCEMHESARVPQGRPATGTLAHVCPDLAIRDVHILFLSFPGEDDRVISIIWRGCSSAPEPKALIKSSGSLPFADHLPPRAHPLQDPIEDRCVLGASCREPRTALYLSWSDWSQKAGESAGNQKTFFEKPDGRGFRDGGTPMLGHRHRLGPGKVGQPAEAVLGVSRRQGIHPIPVLIQASCDQYGKICNS
jgi:hypothetical protein